MTDEEFALLLSVEGVEVEDATTAQLILSDQLTHLKVQTNQDPPHAGVISLTLTGGVSFSGKTILYSFDHNYTHRPTIQALSITNIAGDDRTSMLPIQAPAFTINMEADEDKVYLYFEPNAPPFTPAPSSYSIRYQVYVDEAA